MSNRTAGHTTHEAEMTDADYQAAIRKMYARMDELDVQIERNQAETDLLKAETRAILATFKTRIDTHLKVNV